MNRKLCIPPRGPSMIAPAADADRARIFAIKRQPPGIVARRQLERRKRPR
jgi:hypothetical protein